MTRAEDRLYARISGQPSYRLFASGPAEFFYRSVPATVSFDVSDEDRATALVLHQNGRDFRCRPKAREPR